MGKIHLEREVHRRTLVSIFTTIVIAFAIVSFWRGIWCLMDLYFFPKEIILSLVLSVVLGIFILFLTKHLMSDLV